MARKEEYLYGYGGWGRAFEDGWEGRVRDENGEVGWLGDMVWGWGLVGWLTVGADEFKGFDKFGISKCQRSTLKNLQFKENSKKFQRNQFEIKYFFFEISLKFEISNFSNFFLKKNISFIM